MSAPSRSSRPVWRVLATIVLVAVGAFGGASGPVGAGPAAPTHPGQEPTPESGATQGGDAAISDLVGCVQGSKRLIAVFLIDESQSLQVTDPDDQRVEAAQAALDGLRSLTEGTGEQQAAVDVRFAAFANTFRPVGEWTPLTPDNTAILDRTIDSFTSRNQGIDTDFLNALAGARSALADQSALITEDGSPAPCKAVFFFTDGEYDVAVRTPATAERLGRTKTYAPGVALDSEEGVTEAEAAGREELCREGGLADGIRNDDITILSVALAADENAESQQFLAAVTEGEADGLTCGSPVGTAAGAYVAAGDVDSLVARFDEVAARVAGATPVPGPTAVTVCAGDPCAEGARQVQFDRSVRQARLLALGAEPGLEVQIDGPGGSARIGEPGTSEIGPIEVVATDVAGRGLSIELARPDDDDGAWSGAWTFTIVDPDGAQDGQPATLQIYLFSDVSVALGADAELVRGEAGELTATIGGPEGSDVADLIASASATVRLDDPIGQASERVQLTGPPEGPFTGTFTPPADYTSSSYMVTVELEATTEDGGTIAARSAPTAVIVQRPGGSIQMSPPELQMDTLTGEGSTQANLVLVGGAAAGCIWFGDGTIAAPPDAAPLNVTVDGRASTTEEDCIPIASEQTLALTVEVTPAARATGAVRGVLEVNTKVEGSEANLTQVPYRFDLSAGIDQVRRLAFAVLLLAVGLAVPLLLLVLINALSARFQVLDAVRGAVIPVRVSGTDLFRTDGERRARLALRPRDFTSLSGTGEKRRFAFGGVEFRARASRNPFGSTAALAAPEGGAEKLKGNAGSKVELDPSLAGSWLFMLDPDRTRRAGQGIAEGDLIAFVADGDEGSQLGRMQRDIDGRLQRSANELAGLVRGKKRKVRKQRAQETSEADASPEDDADTGDDASHEGE